RGAEDRAAVDRHDVMRARCREADLQHITGAAPRMQHGAAPAVAVRVDDLVDNGLDPSLLQRFDDEAALPRAIGCAIPVLQRAAAADAEMRADRLHALSARSLDLQ